MIRYIGSLVLAVALVLVPVAPVRADHNEDPATTTAATANPYEQAVKDARKAYEDAYRRYVEAYQRAYWGWAYYQAYYRAYYDLYAAYGRYVYALRYYQWYEAQGTRIAGRVHLEPCVRSSSQCPSIEGATVQLTTYAPPGTRIAIRLIGTKTTDAGGRFDFTGLSEGRLAYSVTKAGFSTVSGTIDVKRGANSLSVGLRRTRGITGTVLARPLYGIVPADPPPGFHDPRPLSGAKVMLYRADVVYIRAPDPDRTVITGADGRFDFSDIDFASARVVVEIDQYRTKTEYVDLSRGPADLRMIMEYTGPLPMAPNSGPSADDVNVR